MSEGERLILTSLAALNMADTEVRESTFQIFNLLKESPLGHCDLPRQLNRFKMSAEIKQIKEADILHIFVFNQPMHQVHQLS